MSGTMREFLDCYHPTWGRHLNRTYPVPGNHDYETPNAAPYFQYFGSVAGPPGLGYYSYRVGAWQVLALNSEIAIGPGSAQMAWLRAELAANRSRCTAAQWHRPLFTSGPNGDNEAVREVWRTLYEFGGEIVLNGHDHLYERFAPQDPNGRADLTRGIRQFTVGTGGATLYPPTMGKANSEVVGTDWGVLKLTLEEDRYGWEFVPVDGARFSDAGSGSCH
jgi:3',5'-cyclic AMP phosphodiesterase CpdA